MSQKKSEYGTLFLIPMPIGREAPDVLAGRTLDVLHDIKYFFAERGKTERAFLKAMDYPHSLQRDTQWWELGDESDRHDVNDLMSLLGEGKSVAVLSEAGAPGIADPGSRLVAAAHRHDFPVRPLIGPSSIYLALMGFGMNGQKFTFHGYLPRGENERQKALRRLERESRNRGFTQLFMETPYRNMKMLESCIEALRPDTRLGIAVDLTADSEWIRTLPVKRWRRQSVDLHKRPAMFGIEG